jgi:hypothetical protein
MLTALFVQWLFQVLICGQAKKHEKQVSLWTASRLIFWKKTTRENHIEKPRWTISCEWKTLRVCNRFCNQVDNIYILCIHYAYLYRRGLTHVVRWMNGWIGTGWNEMEWNGMKWNGMGWNGIECEEIGWIRVKWSGIETEFTFTFLCREGFLALAKTGVVT